MSRFLFLFVVMGFGVPQQIDPAATRAIDQLLQGARIFELPQGKQLVADNSWHGLAVSMFSEATTLFEGPFETDTPGVQGGRRLVELTGNGTSDGLLTEGAKALRDINQKYDSRVEPLRIVSQRFLIIAYQDAVTKAWKVMSMTSKTDTASEVKDMQAFDQPDKYSRAGAMPSLKRYWYAIALIADGKLARSRQELEACLQMAKSEKGPDRNKAPVNSVVSTMKDIDAILGRK